LGRRLIEGRGSFDHIGISLWGWWKTLTYSEMRMGEEEDNQEDRTELNEDIMNIQIILRTCFEIHCSNLLSIGRGSYALYFL
jgi:hypothetical protein